MYFNKVSIYLSKEKSLIVEHNFSEKKSRTGYILAKARTSS